MSNVVNINDNKQSYMVMPIRDLRPNPETGFMEGNMFVAFTKEENKIVFKTPERLSLETSDMRDISLEPLALESFIVDGFTTEDVFSSSPVFGNITPPENIKTDAMRDEFTTVVMNKTDGRMATYLVKNPKEGEEIYLAILDYKVAANIVEENATGDEEFTNYKVSLDYDNLDMDISLQSISKLTTENGVLTIPEINTVPQQVEFSDADSLNNIVVEDEPEELQDLLDSAVKLYFGSANNVVNNQLVDFYLHYIIAHIAADELISNKENM